MKYTEMPTEHLRSILANCEGQYRDLRYMEDWFEIEQTIAELKQLLAERALDSQPVNQ